jgi:hypothetical protein
MNYIILRLPVLSLLMQKANASVVVILVQNWECKTSWGFEGPDVAFKTVLEPEVLLQRGTSGVCWH